MRSRAETLEVRRGTDADIPGVIELMRAALGEGTIPRTQEFWLWKHRKNPFGQSPMWVALDEGRVVGVRLFLRWKWRSDGEGLDAVRAVDTATHPDYQGRGIFKRLTMALVDEMRQCGPAFVFNTPNGKSRPGYLKMGWQMAGRLSLWVRPRPVLLTSVLIQQGKCSEIDEPSCVGQSEIEAAIQQAGREGLLQKHAAGSQQYRTPVDNAYLEWRYLRCPAARYQAFSTHPSRALVICRVRQRNGLRELAISDIFYEDSLSGIKQASESIRAVVARAKPDYVIAALSRSMREVAVMTRAGFMPAPFAGPVLTVRELAGWGTGPDPRRISNFKLSIGDMELF